MNQSRHMPLLNITEHVSGEEDQVAQHYENKTSLQWWNCDMKPMNQAGKNCQYERYHQRHLLRRVSGQSNTSQELTKFASHSEIGRGLSYQPRPRCKRPWGL